MTDTQPDIKKKKQTVKKTEDNIPKVPKSAENKEKAKAEPKDEPRTDAPKTEKHTVTNEESKKAESEIEPKLHKPVPEQFIADLKAFAGVISANPPVLEQIREVFEYHLVDPLDRKTFPKIVNAMSMILGSQATMVVMTATHVNNTAFFEDILAVTKDDEKVRSAVWILQHLTAIYGNRVQQAYSLSSGTMDEDWHTIDVNTFRREGEQSYYQLSLNMTLYNGTVCDIKMTPDSALQLISILAEELGGNIPVEFFDSELVKKCRENNEKFYKKFFGDEDGEKKEEDPAGYA
ncbi:MAG TPA: hypothetical protein O0X39_06615 [Methanocorpusculum sp.]|nr:hypothetical protein [Methanocorpusculum sp.]